MKMKYGLIPILFLLAIGVGLAQASFEITSTPPTTATANTQYTYQVEVSNPDNEPLTFGLDESPSGMTINQNGLISWVPAQSGNFPVTIRVSGDNESVTQAYTLQVAAAPAQLSAQHLNLGGPNQERGVTITQNWNIQNTGSVDVTNLNIAFSGVASRYNIEVTAPSTIPANGNVNAVVTVTIPADEQPGLRRIGSVQITGNSETGSVSLTRDVNLETKRTLSINEVEVRIDGRREVVTNSPAVIDRHAELGSEVRITTTLENLDNNLDLRNVHLELFSNDLPSADGLTAEISRLRPGRTADLTVSFTIDPRETDPFDAPFEIDIMVDARDDDNVRHTAIFTIEIEMEIRTRDLQILDARPSPTVILCGQNQLRVFVEVRNTGLRDITDGFVRAQMPQLNIQSEVRNIDLFDGERDEYQVILNLPPERSAGTRDIVVSAHPTRTSTSTSTELITVSFNECRPSEEPPVTPPPSNGIDVDRPPTTPPTTPPVTGVPVDETRGSPLGLNDNVYIFLLIVLVLVLLIVLVAVLLKLMTA